MRKKRNTNNNKDRKGWVNAFATSRRSGGRTWLWYRNNGEKSSRERGSEKYHRWKLLSKSFQGTREIERFCIDRFEFLLENFAARLDETKFRDLDEREERRIILYPRYIRNFPTVKKGEHFFFFFRKLRYSVFPQIYYYIHADSSIPNNRVEIDRRSSPRKTGIVGGISAEPRVYWICSTFFFQFSLGNRIRYSSSKLLTPHFLVSCFFFFAISRGIREWIRFR